MLRSISGLYAPDVKAPTVMTIKNVLRARHIPVIPVTGEIEVKGLRFEVSQVKQFKKQGNCTGTCLQSLLHRRQREENGNSTLASAKT
jgi:hypothetical protein